MKKETIKKIIKESPGYIAMVILAWMVVSAISLMISYFFYTPITPVNFFQVFINICNGVKMFIGG